MTLSTELTSLTFDVPETIIGAVKPWVYEACVPCDVRLHHFLRDTGLRMTLVAKFDVTPPPVITTPATPPTGAARGKQAPGFDIKVMTHGIVLSSF